jgi:hypothetical protein
VKDTPPEIERKFRQMLMKRSGEERLKMGCSMHATAQALAKASLLQQHPGARPAEINRLLFLHFYGTDFGPEERKRIASALAKRGRAISEGETFLINSRIVESSDAVRDKAETSAKMGKKNAKRSRQDAK